MFPFLSSSSHKTDLWWQLKLFLLFFDHHFKMVRFSVVFIGTLSILNSTLAAEKGATSFLVEQRAPKQARKQARMGACPPLTTDARTPTSAPELFPTS